MTRPAIRWLRFNTVGILGAGVQLGALWLLLKAGLYYLAATAIAVELAVLHNYAWHRRWTWAGRSTGGALLRFHLANGLVSILSNVVLMRVFTGGWGLAPVAANVLAIALTSVINFGLGERWVFPARTTRRTTRHTTRHASQPRLDAGKIGIYAYFCAAAASSLWPRSDASGAARVPGDGPAGRRLS